MQRICFSVQHTPQGLVLTTNDFFGSQDMGFLREKFMETISSGIDCTIEIKVYPQGGSDPIWL